MKIKVLAVFFILIFTSNLVFAGILGYTNDKVLNLEDSINLALLNNRNLLIANEDINITKYKTDEALAYRLLQLDLSAGYNHYKLENPYNFLTAGGTNYFLDGSKNDQHTLSFNMSQIIYSGRRTQNTKKTSEVILKRLKSEYEIIKKEIIYNTKLNYYQYLLYKEKLQFLDLIENYLNVLNANRKILERDYNTLQDFNRFYKNIIFVKDETLISEKLTRLGFFNVIGIEQDSLVDIDGKLGAVESTNMDLDYLIAKALHLRPELISSEASEELGFLEINISMAEKNPMVALIGGYQFSSEVLDVDSDYWKKDWHVGVAVNIPIFDGGAWIARNNQKNINLRKLKLKRSDMEEKIKLEVKSSFMKFEHSKRRLDFESEYYENFKNNYVKDFLNENPYRNLEINNKEKWLDIFNFIKKYSEDTFTYLETIEKYNNSTLNLYYVIGEID